VVIDKSEEEDLAQLVRLGRIGQARAV